MSLQSHVILRIKSQYNDFRELDRKIADYIMNHPQGVIYSTISEVAEQLSISEATVFRFCKKIGYEGFQAFKIALASEVSDENLHTNEQIKSFDNPATIMQKVFRSNIAALEDTLNFIDANNINLAAKVLVDGKRIVFYGNGGSGVVAMDAHHKFLRTGLTSAAYTDSHMQLMSVSQLTKEDVIVVISHTGSNKNMLQVLDIAKENGVKTIGITSFTKSPISKKVDILLSVISQETDHQFEAFASRIAHLSVIDTLYVTVSVMCKEMTKQAINKMRSAISHTRV